MADPHGPSRNSIHQCAGCGLRVLLGRGHFDVWALCAGCGCVYVGASEVEFGPPLRLLRLVPDERDEAWRRELVQEPIAWDAPRERMALDASACCACGQAQLVQSLPDTAPCPQCHGQLVYAGSWLQ